MTSRHLFDNKRISGDLSSPRDPLMSALGRDRSIDINGIIISVDSLALLPVVLVLHSRDKLGGRFSRLKSVLLVSISFGIAKERIEKY